MKDFKEFVKDINEGNLNSRVEVRDMGRYSSTDGGMIHSNPTYKNNIIGWFSNKYNPAFGWVIAKLDDYDTKWIKDAGFSTDGIYRSFTDKATNIIKINVRSGTYAFADSKWMEETDELRFEKSTKFKRLLIDAGKEKEFGV